MDEVNSSASSTRRPKAKARPRRGGEADGGGIIIIRYGTAHDCRNMVRNHRGKFHVGGAELKQLGLASRDEVVESGGDQQVIKCMTSTRDMDLPPSYQNMGDNVRCGLLELLPPKGVSSAHEDWGLIQAAQAPRRISFHCKRDANWTLSSIHSDLRHRLGRTHHTASINRHQISTIPCDEGGWVKIDEILKVDVLWPHESPRTDGALDHSDHRRRTRQLSHRLQLFFDGNHLNATKPNKSKIRLQFLGIRVMDPPNGDDESAR